MGDERSREEQSTAMSARAKSKVRDERSREEHLVALGVIAAEALFTIAKTLKATLVRVYRRLCVRSRAECGQNHG